MLGIVRVPSRFESLKECIGAQSIGGVLLEVEEDLLAIKQALAEISTANQGKILFLEGEPGVGKTTLAEASRVFLANVIADSITVPKEYDLSIEKVPGWINQEIKKRTKKDGFLVFNMDGRELPVADENALQRAMVNLNALLRGNKRVLILWPVREDAFAQDTIEILNRCGAKTALTSKSIHLVRGVTRDRFIDALHLLLSQLGVKLADAAVTNDEAIELAQGSSNLGDFLERLQGHIVSRYDLGELSLKLPKLSIVISADGDISQACRMVRRGNGFLIDPERLLQFSHSNIADDWKRDGARSPKYGLPFIVSLLEVKVASMTASSLVHACTYSNDPDIKGALQEGGALPKKFNAWNLMKSSPLVRMLENREDVGAVASTQPRKEISDTFKALQDLSKKKHRAINESIIQTINSNANLVTKNAKFEYRPLGEGKELRVDVWCEPETSQRPIAIEFTHRQKSSEAMVATYVLTKIRDYARDYGLI